MTSSSQYRYMKQETLLRILRLIGRLLVLDLMKLEKIPLRFLQKTEIDLANTLKSVNGSDRYIHQPYICANGNDGTENEAIRKDTKQKIENYQKNNNIKA